MWINIKNKMHKNKDLKQRIIDISYKEKLSHIGSCLSAVDIIDHVYRRFNKKKDRFVLSQGHAGLALYVVLEKYFGIDPIEYLHKAGIHPDRSLGDLIHCSTGSLGQGLPIAVGMAHSNSKLNVHCVISDGELAEGSIWEAINFLINYPVDNLHIYLNANGYTGYGLSDMNLVNSLSYHPNIEVINTIFEGPSFLTGLKGHYQVLNEEQYNELTKYYEQ
jgi:transketolase